MIIGKGGMKENTERACKEFGAIHCVFPAGNAVVAATEVEEIVRAEWRDLGMPETLCNCHVKEFFYTNVSYAVFPRAISPKEPGGFLYQTKNVLSSNKNYVV